MAALVCVVMEVPFLGGWGWVKIAGWRLEAILIAPLNRSTGAFMHGMVVISELFHDIQPEEWPEDGLVIMTGCAFPFEGFARLGHVGLMLFPQ